MSALGIASRKRRFFTPIATAEVIFQVIKVTITRGEQESHDKAVWRACRVTKVTSGYYTDTNRGTVAAALACLLVWRGLVGR